MEEFDEIFDLLVGELLSCGTNMEAAASTSAKRNGISTTSSKSAFTVGQQAGEAPGAFQTAIKKNIRDSKV